MDTTVNEGLLEKLGFTKVATKIKEIRATKRKMSLAYELYRYVTPAKLQEFQKKLWDKTKNWDNRGGYHKLEFIKIQDYEAAPPASVLDSLAVAQGHQIFDAYEIAYIKKVDDPLLFGLIDGCPDKFFIDQWDDDVKITDILAANEG